MPLKKAWRAREMSWLDEYLDHTAVNKSICGGSAVADSESTVNETPTVLRKWFCTRIKSNEDGTNTTVLALCTADFKTDGKICDKEVINVAMYDGGK